MQENEELVPYLGKKVSRRGFRVYIFSRDGRQRIAESYDEFELFTNSNEWFATKEEADSSKKPVKKKSIKIEKENEVNKENNESDEIDEIEESLLPNKTGE